MANHGKTGDSFVAYRAKKNRTKKDKPSWQKRFSSREKKQKDYAEKNKTA